MSCSKNHFSDKVFGQFTLITDKPNMAKISHDKRCNDKK